MTTWEVTDTIRVRIEDVTTKERVGIDTIFKGLEDVGEVFRIEDEAFQPLNGDEELTFDVEVLVSWSETVCTDVTAEHELPDYWKDNLKHVAKCCKRFCEVR